MQRIDAPTAHANHHTGTGVNIAILDTGIDGDHPALNVAIDLGINCIDAGSTSTEDVRGHGTHVAGTASALVEGSTFVGAATHATVVPVKVLDDNGSGSWDSVICGIDHVTNSLGGGQPITVANMSLSGPGTAGDSCDSSALRKAICNSVDAGVVHVVAAGNDGWNAANSIPAAYPEALTVSALDENRCVRFSGGGPPRTECGAGVAEPLINAPRAATAAGSAPPPDDINGVEPAPEEPPTEEPGDPTTGITLDVNGYKVRGVHHADLVWQGATTNVDIVRDGSPVARDMENTGSYTDNIGAKGGGSYTYQVCEAGTDVCSPPVTATF